MAELKKASHSTQGRRGRRPLDEVRANVIDAAAQVLMEESIAGFTVEKVIRRSGVSSATIYKHWGSRGALALDGFVHAVGEQLTCRDTGDIRRDLTDLLRAFIRVVTVKPVGQVFAQLIGAAQTDAELAAQFEHHYFGPRRRQALELLAAARERGQIRADADLDALVDTVWGSCYLRLLLPNLTGVLVPSFAAEVVDLALRGAG